MMRHVRTTVTLDDDVFAELRKLAADRGMTFKDALNSVLRRGLQPATTPSRKRYRLPSLDLGLSADIDLDKANRLAADLEDGEILRKLELRK